MAALEQRGKTEKRGSLWRCERSLTLSSVGQDVINAVKCIKHTHTVR